MRRFESSRPSQYFIPENQSIKKRRSLFGNGVSSVAALRCCLPSLTKGQTPHQNFWKSFG
ncbi:hypothetical protein SACS_0752 [Parasaccharibacter apium]|uniref:Uncharacterized protein n=1 Tax=Parasaccharibacter apium TaxID=1510841 RepID=A0A7U7G5G0_9PROT|nr:hypothetical protein SACS_0752 [Parasaccharibacter apium]